MQSPSARPGPSIAPSRALLYVGMLLQILCSAGTYLAAKRALAELPWEQLGLFRFAGASLCLLLLLRLLLPRGQRLPPREVWAKIALLALFAVPLNQGFFLGGLQLSSAAHAALLYTLTPLFVLALAQVLLGERLGNRAIAGTLLALAGALFVLLSRGLHGQPLGGRPLLGDLLILVAVLAWAVYTTEGRPLVQRFGALPTIAWTLIGGTLLYLPLGLAGLLVPAHRAAVAHASLQAWLGVGYLIVITSVISYLLWYWALGHLPAARVAVFSNLLPPTTAVLAHFLLGEPVTVWFFAGAAVVIAGVLLAQSGAAAARAALPAVQSPVVTPQLD